MLFFLSVEEIFLTMLLSFFFKKAEENIDANLDQNILKFLSYQIEL